MWSGVKSSSFKLWEKRANYAFKPIAELTLGSFRPAVPQRLNAALEITRIAVVKLVKCGKTGDEYFGLVVPGVGWKLGKEVET